MDVSTLKDMDFKDKKVIMRLEINVPVADDGTIKNDSRLKISIPSIKYILDKGAKQIIMMGHMGRPKNKEPNLKTDKVAERLGELLGVEAGKVDDWGENGIPDSKVVVLENSRFNPAEKSKDAAERDAFGKQLASLADIYVNDAFGNCHRDQATMTSVPKFIPGCVGLSVEKEVENIGNAIKNPEKPMVAIIGGLKADKLNTIKNLLPITDNILVGGALAFTLLKASGYEVGDSKIDDEGLESLKGLVEEVNKSSKIVLPKDAVVADKFDENANSKIVPIDEIEKGWMALDIGPDSVKEYCDILRNAKTILWFGPIGVFEFEKFANGTKEIADVLAESNAVTIIGGGDSATAVKKLGLADKMTLVSSGGGASLQLIEKGTLPAIEVLKVKA
jgi:phosphoglycerate kinase